MRISDFVLEINNISVDTFPLFIQLAADTISTHKEIDLLYETDKFRFQNAVIHSPYASCPLFAAGGIDRQVYAAKYLGIFLTAIDAGQSSPLYQKVLTIMNKRMHALHHYITNCEIIDLSEVTKPQYYPTPAQSSQTQNLLAGAAAQYIHSFISLYPVIDLPLHASLKYAMFMACALRRQVVVSDSDTLSVIQILAGQLDNTRELQLLRKRLNKTAVKNVARYLKNTIYQKSFCNYLDPWRNDRLLEGLAHCSAYLSAEEGISLLSPNMLSQIKQRDVELLCRLYVVKMVAETFRFGQLQKNKDELEMDCAEFVMLGLNFLRFVREYKKAKKYYAEQSVTHLHSELDNLKKQLNEREAEIRKITADLAVKNNLLAMKEAELNSLARWQQYVANSNNRSLDRLRPNGFIQSATLTII